MPQFDAYLRNALQWGFRQISAESPDAALEEAWRLIKDDPTRFKMFYDGEFCDTVTQIEICAAGSNDELAMRKLPAMEKFLLTAKFRK